MSEPTKEEQVAAQINAFLRTVGAPVTVLASECTFTLDGGVRVTKKIADVHFTVDVGKESLAHLAVAHSLLAVLGGFKR